jgi:hypothetical protein
LYGRRWAVYQPSCVGGNKNKPHFCGRCSSSLTSILLGLKAGGRVVAITHPLRSVQTGAVRRGQGCMGGGGGVEGRWKKCGGQENSTANSHNDKNKTVSHCLATGLLSPSTPIPPMRHPRDAKSVSAAFLRVWEAGPRPPNPPQDGALKGHGGCVAIFRKGSQGDVQGLAEHGRTICRQARGCGHVRRAHHERLGHECSHCRQH